MRLELHKFFVKQLKFGDKTSFSGGTLTVNRMIDFPEYRNSFALFISYAEI